MGLHFAVNQEWSLHQLDVSNAFPYDKLDDEVFVEQSLGYITQGESSNICFLQ